NFAPKGNMVASVSPGTGLMVMATDQVEAFNNVIKDNQTFSVSVVSFYITGRPMEDKGYDPITEGGYIQHKKISRGGANPAADRGEAMATVLVKRIPERIYDGIRDPKKGSDRSLGVYFKNNGAVQFANLHWNELDPMNPTANKKKVDHDLKTVEGELPSLPEV